MRKLYSIDDDLEVKKEECCIEDVLEVIKVHMKRGEHDLAIARCIDAQNSIQRVQNIHSKYSTHSVVIELSERKIQQNRKIKKRQPR